MLFVVLAVQVSPWWISGLAASVILFVLGLRKSRESHSILAEFAITRRVQLNALESLSDPLDVYWKTKEEREAEELERRNQEAELKAILASRGFRVEQDDAGVQPLQSDA
jgi:hypothetical protein